MGNPFAHGTNVLVSPRWEPGQVKKVQGDRIHVTLEDGRVVKLPPRGVAIPGRAPSAGNEVLVEVRGSWRRARVLSVRSDQAQIQLDEDEEWVPARSLAVFVDEEPPRGRSKGRSKGGGKASSNGGGKERSEGRSDVGGKERSEGGYEARPSSRDGRRAWWWQNSSLVVLGFGFAGVVFGLVPDLGGWGVALTWFSLHAILAAYVLCHDHTLPRFHPAGFGKPIDPGFSVPGFTLERAPLRSKWELALLMVGGWFVVGVGMHMGDARFIGPLYVCLVGIGMAALADAHDRGSAREAQRLLRAAPIVGASHSGEGRLAGTVAMELGEQPVLWREVLMYSWSTSRQVTKTVTDQDGNTHTVQETETSHYACGFRRERSRKSVRIETSLGPLEVPLRELCWAGERTLSFEPTVRGWRPNKPSSQYVRDATKTSAFEAIEAGRPVVVLGTLRQGSELPELVGGEQGSAVLFGAGEDDPMAVLGGQVFQRRALLAAMVVLGLGSLLAI